MPSASSSTSCRATSRTSNRTTASQPPKNCCDGDSTTPPVTAPTSTNQDHDESFDDDDPRTPEQRDPNSPNYVDRYAHLYNNEDDPFDFENYDEEQYRRDGDGGRALRHIYGSKEVRIVAIDAVNHHHCDTSFDETYIPDRDFTPIENPEDDPYGKGSYGYNALRFAYGDNDCVRAANKAVAEFKKRKAEHPEEGTDYEGPPPDHWSLDRTGNRSAEEDESSENPDPGESEPNPPKIQTPANTSPTSYPTPRTRPRKDP